MSDVPVAIIMNQCGHEENKEFEKVNRDDILATIEFLYKRGMWSKFHYTQWKKMAMHMDAEALHLWWDSIVGGAMFEMESPKMEMLEAKTEKMEEMAEEMVEHKMKSKMMKSKMSSFSEDKMPKGKKLMKQKMMK